ncbi:MAG: adenylate/guanylate cyclase domain-containing protein [Planctomycetes bacterium]|nr:adenylate/guanylate cyclase domain-containing protein [Planctomycetota bacterium]
MRDDQVNRSDPDIPASSMALGVRETMGDAESASVMQVSRQGVVFFVNSNMTRLLDLCREKIEGRPFEEFDTIPWAKGIVKLLVKKMRKHGRPFEITRHLIESESGASAYWRLAVFPREGGRFHVVVEEVTEFQKLRETFEKFVSREVIDLMLKTPERDFLIPARRVVTTLFGDLRGFTAFSATSDPARVQSLLSDFLGAMIAAAKAHRGTVDKVIGDGIMVLWGAPIESETHALDALRAAEAMQREHRHLMKEWALAGVTPPPLGIGVATGEAMVGNLGSGQFMSYTAIGHAVNVAARLCGKAEGGEVLVARDTADVALAQHERSGDGPPPLLKKAGEISVKGVAKPVNVARLVWSDEGEPGDES